MFDKPTLFAKCRFVNDVLHIREGEKYLFRRLPVEWSHGEAVILAFTDCQLLRKIIKGVERVAGVELFIVLPVAAFYFPVVPGCIWPDFLVPNVEFFQCCLKKCRLPVPAASHFIGEFAAVVSRMCYVLGGRNHPLHINS